MRRFRHPHNVNPKDKAEKPRKEVLAKKAPGIPGRLSLPQVLEGEDNVSFERHNRVLGMEWRKTNKNMMVVDELMSRTFAMRRRVIIESPQAVQTLFDRFPFLQDPEQVYLIVC